MNITSLKGTIELDASGYKKGVEEAKRATKQLTDEMLLQRDVMQRRVEAQRRSLIEDSRAKDVSRQRIAIQRELLAETSRLSQVLQQEGSIAQQVAAKYSLLSEVEQRRLVLVKEQISAREATARTEEQAAARTTAADAVEEKALAKLGAEVDRTGQRLRTMGRAMNQAGREMTLLFTVPILAAGAAVLKVGVDVDKGMDAIRLSSGATGERLKGLQADFKAVAATVPNTMEDVGRAIGLVATRTGLVGKPLQDLSRQLLTVSRITKSDFNQTLQQSTRVFGDWGIKVAQQGPALDMLFRASEKTGIGFTKLEETLVRSGAPLRQMGFSFGEAAVLIGKFEKEGVRTDLVLGSLRIALTRLAKAGVTDAHQALLQIINSIKGAGTAAQANAIAMKVFGARAGPDMAAAIREGRFELGKLFDQVTKGQDTIAKAAKNTDDFGQRFGILRNKVELALQPLGGQLMDALDNLGKRLITFVPRLQAMVESFNKLSPAAQNATLALLAFVALSGPTLSFFGKLIGAWGSLQVAMETAKGAAIAARLAIAGPWIAAAIITIGLLVAAWETDFGGIRTAIVEAGKEMSHWWTETVKPLLTAFAAGWHNVADSAKSWFAQIGSSWDSLSARIEKSPLGKRVLGAIKGAGEAQAGAVFGAASGFGAMANMFGQRAEDRARNAALAQGGEGGFGGPLTRPAVFGPAVPKGFPVLPSVGGHGPGGPMDPALAALLAGRANEAQRIEKIMAQARRSALGAGREKGDFATAEQQAALKLYTKDFDDLSAAQKKVADQLARIVIGGEKAAAAQAAHNKEVKEHTAATKDALKHAASLNAQTIDMQRQIEGGAARTHAAQAAALHPKADLNARAAEQAAQADFDRTKVRLTEINALRREAEAIEKRIRAKTPTVPTIGPPVPADLTLDPKKTNLQRRIADDKAREKALDARKAAAASEAEALKEVTARTAEYEAATIKATYGDIKDQLALESKYHVLYNKLSPAMQHAIDLEAKAYQVRQDAIDQQQAQTDLWSHLDQAMTNARQRSEELGGASAQAASATDLLTEAWASGDEMAIEYALAIRDSIKANDELAKSQKDAAAATRAKEKIDNLLANTMADLSAEYDTLTGKQPEQTRAINRLARDTSKLTDEERKRLKEVQAMFKRRELMKGVAEFASGMEGIFQNAFEALSKGFKGFFEGIYQGFKQLLIHMAAEYLASQLKNVVLKGLASLVGAAFGGGGGGGAAPSGGGWGGGFAAGGMVMGGQPIRVGEHGSELFVPPSNGRIIPHDQMAGQAPINVHVHVATQDAQSFASRPNQNAIMSTAFKAAARAGRRNG